VTVARSADIVYIPILIVMEPIEIKADLIPYADEYAETIHSWIDSEETFKFITRGVGFPPSVEVAKTWQREGMSSYILLSNQKPIAYGELWIRPNELAIEIAHVIVDKAHRGEGYGVKLIKLLYDRVVARGDVIKVTAVVHHENDSALSCFVKAGFELSGTTKFTKSLKMIKLII
jgi:ribosomal protein S18 acetylase RimI-like enzyme